MGLDELAKRALVAGAGGDQELALAGWWLCAEESS